MMAAAHCDHDGAPWESSGSYCKSGTGDHSPRNQSGSMSCRRSETIASHFDRWIAWAEFASMSIRFHRAPRSSFSRSTRWSFGRLLWRRSTLTWWRSTAFSRTSSRRDRDCVHGDGDDLARLPAWRQLRPQPLHASQDPTSPTPAVFPAGCAGQPARVQWRVRWATSACIGRVRAPIRTRSRCSLQAISNGVERFTATKY